MKRGHRTMRAAVLLLASLAGAHASPAGAAKHVFIDAASLKCCEYESVPGLVYVGPRNEFTFQELAAYAAPVLWFSPDEPLLADRRGPRIDIPTSFPFEDSASTPVSYYRVRRILKLPNADPGAVRVDRSDRPR